MLSLFPSSLLTSPSTSASSFSSFHQRPPHTPNKELHTSHSSSVELVWVISLVSASHLVMWCDVKTTLTQFQLHTLCIRSDRPWQYWRDMQDLRSFWAFFIGILNLLCWTVECSCDELLRVAIASGPFWYLLLGVFITNLVYPLFQALDWTILGSVVVVGGVVDALVCVRPLSVDSGGGAIFSFPTNTSRNGIFLST